MYIVPKEKVSEFKELASELVKFINDNFNPHTKIIIDCTSAEIVSGELMIPILEYVKD